MKRKKLGASISRVAAQSRSFSPKLTSHSCVNCTGPGQVFSQGISSESFRWYLSPQVYKNCIITWKVYLETLAGFRGKKIASTKPCFCRHFQANLHWTTQGPGAQNPNRLYQKYTGDVWGICLILEISWLVYFDETCMVSLKTHSKTKRTSVEWKRIHLPFGLSRYSAGAVDCNGRKQRKHQHKNEQRNALVIGFMLSLFLFWKLLLFAHDFFTFFHCGCSLTSRFCSPYLQFTVIMDTRYGLQKSANDGTRRIPNPRN